MLDIYSALEKHTIRIIAMSDLTKNPSALDQLTTEARNPSSQDLDKLSSIEIVQLMNSEDAGVVSAVAAVADAIAQAIDVIAQRELPVIHKVKSRL